MTHILCNNYFVKRLSIFLLLLLISCGPSEEEIQARIDDAVEQAIIDMENENTNICFLIVDSESIGSNYTRRNPSLTVTDSENEIIDFASGPKWDTKAINFYGNLNEFNNKKFNYYIYTAGYVINIPKNARYLKIYADYGNSVKTNWWYEWDKDSIESFSESQFFTNFKIGLEGDDSMYLLTNEDFQSNYGSVRDGCLEFVKEKA